MAAVMPARVKIVNSTALAVSLVAQGPAPYPCRYVITSREVDQGPQYSVQVRDWKTGADVAADDFAFNNTTDAKKVEASDLTDIDELPAQFAPKGN